MTGVTRETRIAEWRTHVADRPGVDGHDVDELETHLRDQISELVATGLSDDEAFLVAVLRMGELDELSGEFARENRGRLWKQLVLGGEVEAGAGEGSWPTMAWFAAGAAVAVAVALALGGWPDDARPWLGRNASLLVLPFLAAWFAQRRELNARAWVRVLAAFATAAVIVNSYPWRESGSSQALAGMHLVVVGWFVVAYAYAGGQWRSHERRMEVVRFTGEWIIYYVLLALGGGVLTGLTVGVLEPAGVDTEAIVEWLLPAAAAGGVIVAAWLVEAKQRVVENMAPVLTTIFTPLFAVMLTAAAIVYAITGMGGAFDRELLGLFDALMIVVLGLVLYGMSARDARRPAGWMDRVQLLAVVSALVLDLMVLASMLARIGAMGFTPNRTAALGLNLVLLVDLAVTAQLSARFLRGRATFHRLERWQTSYLPIFGLWAVTVVVALPPLFSFG